MDVPLPQQSDLISFTTSHINLLTTPQSPQNPYFFTSNTLPDDTSTNLHINNLPRNAWAFLGWTDMINPRETSIRIGLFFTIRLQEAPIGGQRWIGP
jgi:hypothetical protein